MKAAECTAAEWIAVPCHVGVYRVFVIVIRVVDKESEEKWQKNSI